MCTSIFALPAIPLWLGRTCGEKTNFKSLIRKENKDACTGGLADGVVRPVFVEVVVYACVDQNVVRETVTNDTSQLIETHTQLR